MSPRCSSIVVPCGPFRHQEAHVVRAEGFEDPAPLLVSSFFQDSPEIHIHILWTQQGSNASTCTFTLKLLSRYCFCPRDNCSFSRIPSSSFFFIHSVAPHKGGTRFLRRCGRCHPFFLRAGVLSLVSLRTSSLPAYLYHNVHAIWRKKRTAVPQISIRATRRNITKLSHQPKKGKQAHQSQQVPHAHAHKNQSHIRQVHRLLQEVFPGKTSATLHISPLTKISKASTETKPSHLLLTVVVSISSLSSSLFNLFFSFSLSFSFFFPFVIFP